MIDLTKLEGHTAGPWFRDGHYIYAKCQREGEKPILEMLDGRIEDTDANMALITAAPTLLERAVITVSSCQKRQLDILMKSWICHGEFDPMDYIAANRGWHPLTVNESMSVNIGKKRYRITRES